jgi:hypothetical protein
MKSFKKGYICPSVFKVELLDHLETNIVIMVKFAFTDISYLLSVVTFKAVC